MSIKCIIVEDEKAAQEILVSFIARVEWLEARHIEREADLALLDVLLRELYATLIQSALDPKETFAGFKERLLAEVDDLYSRDLRHLRTLEETGEFPAAPPFEAWKERLTQRAPLFLDQLEVDIEP